MPISVGQSLAIIAVAGICTFATRLFPFALFSGSKTVPPIIKYLGKVLPPAVIIVLIVYCLRDVTFTATSILPQLLSILLVAVLHIWKRNNLLSIGGGTAFYMFLVQVVFA